MSNRVHPTPPGDILKVIKHDDSMPPDNRLNDAEQLLAPLLAPERDPRHVRLDMPKTVHGRKLLNRNYNSLAVEPSSGFAVADVNLRGNPALTNSVDNKIQLSLPPGFGFTKQNQWPDAVQLYWLIRSFSIMPQVTTGAGDAQVFFVSAYSGTEVGIGDFSMTNGGQAQPFAIIPDLITDVSNPALGTLHINWLGGAAGVSVGYQLGLSLVYLLPTHLQYAGEEHDAHG